MSISAGELDQLVQIQGIAGVQDGAGGTNKVWSTFAKVWAKVEPLNGGEAFAQGIARATQFYRVTMRFRTDTSPGNRLMWGVTPLNIRTCAPPDGRREMLVITAESGAAEPA